MTTCLLGWVNRCDDLRRVAEARGAMTALGRRGRPAAGRGAEDVLQRGGGVAEARARVLGGAGRVAGGLGHGRISLGRSGRSTTWGHTARDARAAGFRNAGDEPGDVFVGVTLRRSTRRSGRAGSRGR